jgi:hypothetical protein
MPISPQITVTPVDIVTKNFDISAVTKTSSTATYTATGHTFSIGDIVLVSGIVPDGYNGSFPVTGIATNTFTVANATNTAITDPVGNAFWTDPTEYEYVDVGAAYSTDDNDVNDLISTNPSLAQALADASTALANAATANATATAAAYAAGVAQASANGKNTSHYSTSGPSGGGTAGDLWFQVDGGGTVLYQYAYNGSSWISAPISNTVIANLDAGKITAGTITGIAYNNGSGTFSVSPSGALVASSATITGVIIATSGTFTGTINAASGNIGGFTIGTDYIYSGSSLAIYANGTITGGNSSTLFYGYVNIGGGFAGSERLTVAGSSAFNGSVLSTNNITSQTHFYAPYATNVTSAANGYYVTSSGRLTYTTASSQRYKKDITDLISIPEYDPKKLLSLPVRAFRYNEGYVTPTDDRADALIPGFIAEEVDAIYPIACDYSETNGPESWNDRVIIPGLLALIQNQEKRIQTLEGK